MKKRLDVRHPQDFPRGEAASLLEAAQERTGDYDIVSDPLQYPRWWFSVYLQTAQSAAEGDEYGVGRSRG